jgi:hypothetical protein
MQIADTVIHTWDLTRSIGMDYVPQQEIADLVLRRMSSIPGAARGAGKPFGSAREAPDVAQPTRLDRILLLSGRDIAWQPALRAHGAVSAQ